MTPADVHLRAWADQAIRPIIREILRDELSNIIPTLTVAPTGTDATEQPLTIGQAADFLGISEQTLYQNKKLPRKKRFGRLYFFKTELLAYLDGKDI